MFFLFVFTPKVSVLHVVAFLAFLQLQRGWYEQTLPDVWLSTKLEEMGFDEGQGADDSAGTVNVTRVPMNFLPWISDNPWSFLLSKSHK